MQTVLLIDFNNFVWRSTAGFSNAETKSQHTVIYTFFRSLRSLVESLAADRVYLCGEGGKTFRHALLPEYKANRIIKTGALSQKQLDEFAEQRSVIWELCRLLPLYRTYAPGYEADDVIATLADLYANIDDVIIVSNDKDFIQLLQKPYVALSIYDPFNKDYVKAPEYHQLTFQSLHGDEIDNIPSLVGEKKAIKIASDPKKLAHFLNAEENLANYNLNKELITLKIIPQGNLETLEFTTNFVLLKQKFAEMEFNSILEDWDKFQVSFEKLG